MDKFILVNGQFKPSSGTELMDLSSSNEKYSWKPFCIEVMKLNPEAIIPTRAHPTDAGLDLYYCGESYHLSPGKTAILSTGVAVKIPDGYVGYVCSRSGLAAKNSIAVLNAPGVIDSSYRGEIKVILTNHSESHGLPF